MNRRNFLKSALILTAAPAIVRAESLMPVKQLILPDTFSWNVYGDIQKPSAIVVREFENPRPWTGEISSEYMNRIFMTKDEARKLFPDKDHWLYDKVGDVKA